MSTPIYTQEQLDIAVLKNSQEGVLRELSNIKRDMSSLSSDMKSQFHLTIGLVLGIYAMIVATALGKLIGII